MDGEEFLIGGALGLADLHLVPILDYFARTEDGRAALAHRPRPSAWWRRIERRPSVARTRSDLDPAMLTGLALPMAVGSAAGAIVGAALLPLAPTDLLKLLLGGVLATSAAKLLRTTRSRTAPAA